MNQESARQRVHPLWWTAFMFAVIGGMVLVCSALFEGTFRPFIPVTVISDRAGLIMESGAKVRMRGVEVGRVGAVTLDGHEDLTTLALQMYPNQLKHIPANVSAQIRAIEQRRPASCGRLMTRPATRQIDPTIVRMSFSISASRRITASAASTGRLQKATISTATIQLR